MELFDHLTVCKQMTDALIELLFIHTILENLKLCASKILIVNKIVHIR